MSGLIERAIAEGTPLIDRGEGHTCKVIFVWQGVAPIPQLIGDFTNWQPGQAILEEVEPEVWAYSLDLPDDVFAEYAFVLTPDIEERYLDPFNLRKVWNGITAYNNYFGGPAYTPTPLIRRGAGVKRGTVSEHFIPTDGFLGDSHRQVMLYRPPTDEPVPLVVVWDGADYLARAQLNVIVDNLIAEGSIRPVALALLYNGKSSRTVEYMQNEASLYFVLAKVLPFARQTLNLIDEQAQPGIHGLLGASMGGLMALFGGLRLPQVFGHVLSQSGGFWIDDPRASMLIFDLVLQTPTQPIQIWQDVGRLESFLEGNRRMYALLQEKGYKVDYAEYNGGHNFTMWANSVGQGLKRLYGNSPIS